MMRQELLAWAFAGTLICIPLAWLFAIYRRQRYSPPQFGLWVMAHLVVRILWRARLPELPEAIGGSAVVVCNHRSSIDPFFIQVCLDRPMHWMVAREYCEHPLFRWFLKQTEAIPVNRGGVDTASTKQAIRLAEAGGVVGMFPEGRINQSAEFMLPVRPGALLVALKARAPIVPCYIDGAPFAGTPWSPFFMTAQTCVTFGKPVDLSAFYDREHDKKWSGEKMLEIMTQIADLAHVPDANLRLAGRHWKPTEDELRDSAANGNE